MVSKERQCICQLVLFAAEERADENFTFLFAYDDACPLHACSSGNKFFSLSDDRVNGRFYTVQLDVVDDKKTKQLTATITDVVTMLDISGNSYAANTIDPESIRYDRQSQTLVWSSEGDADKLIPPLITEMTTTGKYVGTVPFSQRFAVSCLLLTHSDQHIHYSNLASC
jgi:hypothetical protein